MEQNSRISRLKKPVVPKAIQDLLPARFLQLHPKLLHVYPVLAIVDWLVRSSRNLFSKKDTTTANISLYNTYIPPLLISRLYFAMEILAIAQPTFNCPKLEQFTAYEHIFYHRVGVAWILYGHGYLAKASGGKGFGTPFRVSCPPLHISP